MSKCFAVEREENGSYTFEPTEDEEPIHIHAIEEIAGLESALMQKNYPTDIIVHHRLEAEDLVERGPIGGETEICLYIEELADFAATACELPYQFTISKDVRSRIEGIGGEVR